MGVMGDAAADPLDGLNPVQREAVTAPPDVPLLVVAGAGSGKTRVLTHRVGWLINDQRLSPFALLAITFTNKAAGEMKERVGALVGPVAQRMWVSTFHSACARILRREAKAIGIRSSFSIYDQSDLVRLLTQERRSVMVVGDHDQSIYRFRGADFRNLMRFEEAFPEATVIVLEQNYRSTQRILDAANAVILNNAARRPKHLWTEQVGGELITRYHAQDEHDEAAYVAHEIARLTDTEGYNYSDVAVFYRTNAQSRVIEETLVRAGHPYRVVGGVRFYDRREVKDTLAYLRALVNPDDEVSWRRIVNVPKRGVGDTSVVKVSVYAKEHGMTFRDALHRADAAGVSGKALGGIRDLLDILAEVEGAAGVGVAPVVQAVLEDTGYLAELEAERSIEAEARLENLQELVGVCREFDDALESGDVAGLAGIASGSADGEASAVPDGLDRVQAFLEAVSLVTDLDDIEGEKR